MNPARCEQRPVQEELIRIQETGKDFHRWEKFDCHTLMNANIADAVYAALTTKYWLAAASKHAFVSDHYLSVVNRPAFRR